MKKSVILLAAVFAAFGCSKEPVQNPAQEILPCSNELSITAGTETKAFLDASGATPVMKWRQTDSLVVFDSSLKGVSFGTSSANGSTTAIFTTDKWTGKAPHYAAAYCPNFGEQKILTEPSEGVMSVKFRAAQTLDGIKTSGFQTSACVGKVEEQNGEYVVSQMKNVMGFIGFTLAGTNVKTVKISAPGGENLAGWVDVDYAKLIGGDAAFWTLTEGKTPDAELTLKPASGNFKADTYYASLLPQTYSQGLKFTLLDADGNIVVERTVGSKDGLTISRSKITPLGGKIDVVPVVLPDEIVLDVDFSGGKGTNPLGFTTISSYSSTGETYYFTYNYTEPGTGASKSLQVPFTFKGTSANTYSYAQASGCAYSEPSKYIVNMVLGSGTFGASIQLPVFEDRYLSSIGVSLGNAYAKRFALKESLSGSAVLQTSYGASSAAGPNLTTLKFYTDGIGHAGGTILAGKDYEGYVGKKEQTYYLMPAATLQLGRLVLTYTKELNTR